MMTQENTASVDMELAPDEIRRVRTALVDYMERALSDKGGEVDGRNFPAAVELFAYFLKRIS